jgi:hypothetical protein
MLEEMQPQTVGQKVMFTPPSQLVLENLPCSRIKKRKEYMWRMDQKTLQHKGIKILDGQKTLFYSNQIKVEIIEMWKKMEEGKEACLVTL